MAPEEPLNAAGEPLFLLHEELLIACRAVGMEMSRLDAARGSAPYDPAVHTLFFGWNDA